MMLIPRTQARLLLLCTLLVCLFLAGTLVRQKSEQERVSLLVEDKRHDKVALIQKLIGLRGEDIRTFAYDYSAWDDMVTFCKSRDSAWARENIEAGLATFRADAAWVFTTDYRHIYDIAAKGFGTLAHDPSVTDSVRSVLQGGNFTHCFIRYDGGLIEIRTAPIQPSADLDRLSAAQGYFVVGRVWNESFLKDLGQTVEAALSLQNPAPANSGPSAIGDTTSPTTFIFSMPLPGRDAHVAAELICAAEWPFQAELIRESRMELVHLWAFAAVILVLLSVFLFWWVSVPLGRITSSLASGNPSGLERFRHDRSEFGQIGRLIAAFFEQRLQLEDQVDDLRRAEAALQVSERRFRVVSEQTGQVVYDWEVETGSIHWGGAIEQITGFTSQEYQLVDFKRWEDLVHPEDRAEAVRVLEVARRDRAKYMAEYRLRKKDGTYAYVEDHGIFLENADGDLCRMLGVIKDVTQRKLSEQELVASETLYHTVFDTANDAIFVMKGDRFLDCNSTTLRMYGCTREQIVGQPPYRFSPSTQPDGSSSEEGAKARISAALNGDPQFFEWLHCRYDGTPFEAEVSLNRFEIPGEVLLLAVVRDITRRKNSERALKREEEKYRALIETTGTGYVIINLSGIVLDANPEYVRLAGRTSRDDLIGHSILEWTAAYERLRNADAVDRCMAEGRISGLEIDYVDRDGTITPVEINATVLSTESGIQILALCRDITDRRRSEKRLRETERRLTDVIGFLPDATFVIDLEGKVIVWNHAMEELTRVKAEDMLGRGDFEYAIPFYGVRRPILIDLVLKPSENGRMQYTYVREDSEVFLAEVPVRLQGEIRYLWLKASPLYDNAGNVIGAIETIRDITERKRGEQALIDTEIFLKSIINSVGTGIIIVDAATHKIIDINNYALRLIGIDRDSAKDRTCHRFVCQAEQGRCPISDLHQAVDNSERVLLNVRGEEIPILKTVTPVERQGKTFYIESFLDISVRKMAEQALRLEESRLATLLKLHQMIGASENEIIHFALEEAVRLTGSKIGYIAFSNDDETELTMYAWSTETVLRCAIPDQSPVFKVAETGLWGEAVRERRPIITNDYELPSDLKKGLPDGHVELTRVVNVPIFDGDHIVIVVGVGNKATDYGDVDVRQLTLLMSGLWSIVQRKRSEEQTLQLQDKLDRAQRMESLGVLAGGVAHDLNNMLGPVVGFSELVIRELPTGSKLAGRVTKIMKSAQDAADVIQDLLTLARRGRYEMAPLVLNDVIISYMESPGFGKLKERHPNIDVQLNLTTTLQPIKGSHVHLSKVIMNLVSNACEAMADGGTLTVTTEAREMDALLSGYAKVEPGTYIVMRVGDTGVGISQGDLAKIFEPYYSKKKMGHSGSGLGLSVVYGVVKDHGGYYDVFSEVGRGTEFVLYFPASTEAVKNSTVSNEVVGGNETVLVVDDSPEQRDLARDLISTLGYHVHVVDNGHQAVNYLRDHTADIVVLDMIMEPDFDGLDTYREILKIHPHQKVIVVSGFSATERVQAMQQLGAGGYIRKPYTLEAIAKALRNELNRKDPRSAEAALSSPTGVA